MKKGKTSKIPTNKMVKCSYGTVDSVELKSIYINLQTWVTPITDKENWNRIVLNMSRDIKHIVFNSLNRELFNEKFIVDLDLRSSGLSTGKKSFMNLEITLFLKENNVNFKSNKIKESVRIVLINIINDVIHNNNYFKFYLTKKDNSLKTKSF
jgi:hypothetical protein